MRVLRSRVLLNLSHQFKVRTHIFLHQLSLIGVLGEWTKNWFVLNIRISVYLYLKCVLKRCSRFLAGYFTLCPTSVIDLSHNEERVKCTRPNAGCWKVLDFEHFFILGEFSAATALVLHLLAESIWNVNHELREKTKLRNKPRCFVFWFSFYSSWIALYVHFIIKSCLRLCQLVSKCYSNNSALFVCLTREKYI